MKTDLNLREITVEESLNVKEDGIDFDIVLTTIQDDSYFIAIANSINVSGYGNTVEEAHDSFLHNLKQFTYDFLGLTEVERDEYLHHLGFKKVALTPDHFSHYYVDAEGNLCSNSSGKVQAKKLEQTIPALAG